MDRPSKTLADFVAIAISPLLIMALVGSLVFFLLDILYVGQYQGSLHWVLFFFVFGAVLIARISMTAGIADRAALYGLVLGLLVWLALLRYVEFPPETPLAPWAWLINLGLIAIIWWSAHRLTRDCTLIDDQADASGRGLLDAAGLDKKTPEEAGPGPNKKEPKKKKPGGFIDWWLRYCRYRDAKRKQPQVPGVWVVYFSLAALPLFGLGQSQIPPADAARRMYAFKLMAIYTGSGLGLLLTTSFLGLRRYLRQRNLRMPAAMTGAWLTLGGVLIVLVLMFGALLPQPGATVPLIELTSASSPDRQASRFAQVGEGKEAKKDDEASHQRKSDKDEAKSTSGDKESKKTEGKNKDGKDKSGEKKGEKSSDKKPSNPAGKDDQEQRTSKSGRPEEDKSRQEDGDAKKDASGQPAPPPSTLGGLLNQLAPLLKWIILGVLGVVVLFLMLRSGLRFLANFTHWAQRLLAAFRAWWEGLGALWKSRDEAGAQQQTAMPAPPRPFSDFRDPFLTGRAERMSGGELVQYTFAALEAWACERSLGRHPQETPLEFVNRVSEEVPRLEKGARRLANYYASLAYARGNVGNACRDPLREFWWLLEDIGAPSVAHAD